VSTPDQTHEAIQRLARAIPGLKLPGERELAEQYGVSRQQIRRVLARLSFEGVVERRQGSGTYAAKFKPESMRRIGLWVDKRLRLRDDPFFTLMIERILHACHDDNIRCTVERVDENHPPRAWEDGILTLGMAAATLLPRLSSQDPPAVGLFVDFALRPGGHISLLQMDDFGAGQNAIGWLASQGCSRFVFVGRLGLPVSDARLAGAREASNQFGMKLEAIDARMNYPAGLTVGADLKLSASEKTGVFCANDWLALGVHAGLSGRGVKTRYSVLMAGIDGLPVVADPRVGVRSLRAPLETIASDALAELRRLSGFPPVGGRVVRYPLTWADESKSG
jgi:DNA-binding LacI/PurR family transcriptional regulator